MQFVPTDLYNYLMAPIKAVLRDVLRERGSQQSPMCSDVPNWIALECFTEEQLDDMYYWFAQKLDFIKWLLESGCAVVSTKGSKQRGLNNLACG